MERVNPADSVADALSEAQLAVMMRVLDEEEARREHVVVYLSGAHAYGFPSPDSDLDLKAIHVAKTADLLGFEVPLPTVDRAEVIEGVEIDYTSNELAHALAGILGGNGNFFERMLGRMTARASPLLEELRPIAQRALSRRVHRHYRGFALNQLRFLENHAADRSVRARGRPGARGAKARRGARRPRRGTARGVAAARRCPVRAARRRARREPAPGGAGERGGGSGVVARRPPGEVPLDGARASITRGPTCMRIGRRIGA